MERSELKVAQINQVSRNQLQSTEFLLSTFEFERQNIGCCCKQSFCVQFSSKAKHDFFSFLSGLLNGRKNSNFFKIAVEGSDSMKRNYWGFTFNLVTFRASFVYNRSHAMLKLIPTFPTKNRFQWKTYLKFCQIRKFPIFRYRGFAFSATAAETTETTTA